MATKTNVGSRAKKYMNALGENASIVSNGTIYDTVSYIDTGCYLLNAQISLSIYGGIPSNKIIGLAGEESTGKTFMLLGIVKHYLENTPESVVVLFESEGAINKKMIESRGIDSNRVILKPVVSVEEFRKVCTKFLDDYMKEPKEERLPVLFGLDSLGMLPSQKEVQDAIEGKDKTDMTRAKVIKSIFRILTVGLAQANIPLLVTNHVYSTLDLYAKAEMGGGSGLKYAGSFIIFLSKSQYKEVDDFSKKEDHAGITVTSFTYKSRETKEKKKIKFVIHAKHGVSKYSGLFDFCVEVGLLAKKGNRWYWVSEGEDTAKFRKSIESKPEDFFIKPRLDEIDKVCHTYFGYGDGKSSEFSDEDDFDEKES